MNSGPLLLGGKGDYPPRHVSVFNNFFQEPSAQLFEEVIPEDAFSGNLAVAVRNQQLPQGIKQIKDKGLKRNSAGYYRPVRKFKGKECPDGLWPALKPFDQMDHDATIALDIMQHARPKKAYQKTVGCLEYPSENELKPWVTSQNTGPAYLRKQIEGRYGTGFAGKGLIFHDYSLPLNGCNNTIGSFAEQYLRLVINQRIFKCDFDAFRRI